MSKAGSAFIETIIFDDVRTLTLESLFLIIQKIIANSIYINYFYSRNNDFYRRIFLLSLMEYNKDVADDGNIINLLVRIAL